MATDIGVRLRGEISRRAQSRCEYCRVHDDDAGYPHQVDHVISRKHGGLSRVENLALACVICNRHKGTDIASVSTVGELVRLFHPRADAWDEHFRIDGPFIQPVTRIGEVTVRLLRLNARERVDERRSLQALGRYPTA